MGLSSNQKQTSSNERRIAANNAHILFLSTDHGRALAFVMRPDIEPKALEHTYNLLLLLMLSADCLPVL